MKIVVLDGYTLNPGDLSWDAFHTIGECEIYDRTPSDEIVFRALNADVVLTNKTAISEEVLAKLPNLKYIGVLATGYNVVDVKMAAQRGIPVTNVPEYGTQSVAQMVFAHVLNFANHAAAHGSCVEQGMWSRSKDFCFWEYPLVELSDQTMGIIGLGRIGLAVAMMAQAFGMRVQAYNPRPVKNLDSTSNIDLVDLNTVFEESDFISLHCPLTEESQGLVNKNTLHRMKKSAFLINTSRGPLIDEVALAAALNSGEISGAGLDVLAEEPPSPDCPLLTAKNCCITPHIAWATRSARSRLLASAAENIESFIQGIRINVVNGV